MKILKFLDSYISESDPLYEYFHNLNTLHNVDSTYDLYEARNNTKYIINNAVG